MTTIRFSRADYFWIKINLFVFFTVNFFLLSKKIDVVGNLYSYSVPQTEKIVLGIWADRNNRQRLRIPCLGNIFWPFFFEFSKVNVLKINLTKIFICTNKPHKNLATPIWRRILLSVSVHKSWLSEYVL